MDPLVTKNSTGKKGLRTASANNSSLDLGADVGTTLVTSKSSDNIATILIDSLPHDHDLTVTPAFPNFPTDEEIVMKPDTVILLEPNNDISEQQTDSNASPTTSARPSPQASQLLDELKYLLKPTNSLARPDDSLQASQEADSAIKRRATVNFDDELFNNPDRMLIEGLTPDEIKSLNAAQRRSSLAQGPNSFDITPYTDRTRTRSMRSSTHIRSHSQSQSQSPTLIIAQPEHRTIIDHLSGLVWAFLAAYAFTIILFLTKTFGIDLIFGFFLQMVVQTIAFSVYAFYKGYNLLGPSEHRIAMIVRALLIGIGALTSFLAYYYITLPDLSAIRQSQVILTIILSIFFLHERLTISRILACILTIIAIILLIRPTTIGSSSFKVYNLTNSKTSWIPYSSSWNYLIGIGFALCTAITYSIASIMNKIYFSAHHLHNTVLCLWSALSALVISFVLVNFTHFFIKDARSFPHDWRLFVAIGLAVASIFVFIANQKAIKRERSSIVTLIYSTDIILAFILQNIFTHIKSDIVVILGCLLILASVVIICVEVLIAEKRKNTMAINVQETVNTTGDDNNLQKKPTLTTEQKRLSI